TVQSPGAGTPTGTVTFYDGDEILAVVSLDDNGVATFRTADLAEGDHFIVAVYDGDGNYDLSLAYIIQTVQSESGPGRIGCMGLPPDAVSALGPGRAAPPAVPPERTRPDLLEGLVRRYHRTYLGGEPGPAELREWVGRLRRGEVEEDVVAALIEPSEEM